MFVIPKITLQKGLQKVHIICVISFCKVVDGKISQLGGYMYEEKMVCLDCDDAFDDGDCSV